MRKLLCILLSVLLLGAALPVLAQTDTVSITDAQGLLALAENCRLDSYSQGLTVSLEADIDLTGTEFSGIPIFAGAFQGNGHKITGVQITGQGSNQGFFRYLTESAVVEQLHIFGTVAPEGSRENIGGIAGSNAGVIRQCGFTGQVSGSSHVGGIAGINSASGLIEDCSAEGNVGGLHFAGGMAGTNDGSIYDCENLSSVNVTPQENSVDISNVTLENLTDAESVAAVTDVGGIAGISSGTVRGCVNRGSVGYRHMGYNMGGILGSQSGYVADCENHGAVSGRKDVGGIVGHLEPAVLIDFEMDTLQQLRAQLQILGTLTDRAAANAQNNATQLEAQLKSLEDYALDAQQAIDVLLDPKKTDAHAGALQTLNDCLTGTESTLRALRQTAQDAAQELKMDIQAVTDQLEVISATTENGEASLGGTLTDSSDADTAGDLTGKIESSVNHGAILADLNVGGIVGTVGIENDLDPEEDISVTGTTSLNMAGMLRAVVLDCSNQGAVTAGKRNAGGIVGWQSMGLVKGCGNEGTLDGGSYTGGVAGQSFGYIRNSFAKCALTGTDHVGGIAGSGTVVTDCRTMAVITGTEAVGAVLGAAEDNRTDEETPISGNLYACPEADPGAIDGISYQGKAQPVSIEAFMTLEELPSLFETVTVSFEFADGTRQQVQLPLGEALTPEQIPQVPQLEGCEGAWEGLNDTGLEQVLRDMTFRAVYEDREMTVAADLTADGKPQLLVQGDFGVDGAVAMAQSARSPKTEGTVLAAWELTFTQADAVTGARYLMETDWDPKDLTVSVRTADGSWKTVECTVSGSYLVFPLEAGETAFAVVQKPPAALTWLWVSLAAVLMAGITVTVILIRKKKK